MMTQRLTPPPPAGYFYRAIPVDRYDFDESADRDPLLLRSLKLQLRRKRKFWFSSLVATVFVKADKHSKTVTLVSLDEAAVKLNEALDVENSYNENVTLVKNTVKEINERV